MELKHWISTATVAWLLIMVCTSCTGGKAVKMHDDGSFTMSDSLGTYGPFSNDSTVQAWLRDDFDTLLDMVLETDHRNEEMQNMLGDMEARLDGLSALKDTVWSLDTLFIDASDRYYDIEYDTMGNKCYLPHGNVFRFEWTHSFLDVTGRVEEAIEYSVGLEFYDTKDDMLKRVNGTDRYYHKSYGYTTWREYRDGRKVWEYLFTGLVPNKYAIISLQAIDKAGNRRDWFKSMDSDSACYVLYKE